MSEPITRSEMYLAALNGEAVTPPAPITRMDMYLAYLNGMTDTYPEPITRIEQYLYKLCQNGMGGGVTIRNQDKTITENGEYTADSGYTGLGKVTVNVEADGGGDSIIEDIIAGNPVNLYSESEKVQANAFNSNESIVSVEMPNCTDGGYQCFASTKNLVTAIFSKMQKTGDRMFMSAQSLANISFPIVTEIGNNAFQNTKVTQIPNENNIIRIGPNAFNLCLLTEVNLPNIYFLGDYAFANCYYLTKADIGAGLYDSEKRLNMSLFNKCKILETVILRSTSLLTMRNVATFEGTPIESGTGYVYVPKTLADGSDGVATYQAATNWSTYATQIRAIEDYPEICGEVSA